MISPTAFLTAGHAVDDNRDGFIDRALSSYSVNFNNVNNNGTFSISKSDIASIEVHPGWATNGINPSSSNDMAIVRFTSPIVGISSMSFANYAPETDSLATMVGYGLHGVGSDFSGASVDFKRRAANNIIDSVFTSSIYTDFDSPAEDTSSYGSAVPTALEGTSAGGDSGGPLLVDNKIVAIVRGGFPNPYGDASEYGDRSVWTPVLKEQTREFLELNGAVFVPEPSASIMVLLGSILLLRRSR